MIIIFPEINQRYNNNMRERAIGDGSIVHALAYRFSSSLSLSSSYLLGNEHPHWLEAILFLDIP